MAKKFLFSVADVYFYKTNSNELIFQSKTLVDSSIEVTVQNEDARAGKGNPLQFIYYHSSEFNISLTEQQFNIKMLAPSIGANLISGDIIQTEERITLGAGGTGTVTGTPVNSQYVTGTAVKGSVTDEDGNTEEITFNGSNFTLAGGIADDVVVVTYNILSPSSKSIVVNSNLIPSVGRLVMKAQLGSSESGVADNTSSVVGEIEIEVPSLQLNPSGAGMQMSASGISQSQLSGRALAYTAPGTTQAVYASIKETIYGLDKYADARALVATNSEIELAVAGTATLDLLVVPKVGLPFVPTYSDIVFATDSASVATVSSAGVITAVADGEATITATLSRDGLSDLVATAHVVVA